MIAFMFKSPPTLWGIAFVGFVMLAAGVSAGVTKGGLPGPAWLLAATTGALAALVATAVALRPVFVKTVQGRVDRSISKADAAREVRERLGDAKGRFPRVSEIRGRALRYGVQQAIPLDDGPVDGLSADLPRYLPRTIDGLIRSALTARSTAGGLVILKGNSTWGKSRCMFEAVSQVLGDWLIVAPSKASEVRDLVESGLSLNQMVIWLDEMVDFLTGSDPLTRHVVQRGVDKGAIIVGTIWKDDFAALTDPPRKVLGDQADPLEHGPGTVDELSEARSILLATYAELIEMPRDLDEKESAVAAALAKQDSRWAHALADAGELSPIQVLAAAPQLLHRYRSPDDEAGGVVLRAAVVLLAMEHPHPVPVGLLRRVAEAAMPPTLELDSDRWFDRALAWACRPVRGTISPLRAHRGGADDGPGYVAPDLLVSAARDDGALQDQVNLEQTLTHASADACAAIGSFLASRDDFHAAEPFLRRATEHGVVLAFRQYGYVLSQLEGRDAEAEAWLRKAVDAGDSQAMHRLGILLSGQKGRVGEAEEWFRKAVDASQTIAMLGLGFLLSSQEGRLGESEEWFRKAVDAGDTAALLGLGLLLGQQEGRAGEAGEWLRKAVDAGYTEALLALGLFLRQEGRLGEAEDWYRKAADAGEDRALRSLGAMAATAGRLEEAEEWFRKAVDAGDTMALRVLGMALVGQEGRVGEAEEWLRKAVDAGETTALRNLGTLLAGQEGRAGEAEEWFRKAVDAGDSTAMHRLGVLLGEQEERVGEAEEWFLKAVDVGHSASLFSLGSLLRRQGRLGEAEEWFRKAVDAGDTTALIGLGSLLGRQEGRVGEAEDWYRRAVDAGDTDGLLLLGLLLGWQEGRAGEAEEWLRKAIDAGDSGGLRALGTLLAGQEGRDGEAAEWFRKAVEAGDTTALRRLGDLLRAQEGRAREAEDWYRRAVDAGDTESLRSLGSLLRGQEGRLGEAEECLRIAVDAGVDHALNELGDLLMQLGRNAEARRFLERGIAAGERFAMLTMGELDLLEGRRELGRIWIRKAASLGVNEAVDLLAREFGEDPSLPA